MQSIRSFSTLIESIRSAGTRKRVAIVCPNDSHTEYVINRGIEENIADFILVLGGKAAPFVEELAKNHPECISTVWAETPDEAAAKAVGIVRNGDADVLMKGTINTDNLLRAVLNKEHGLLGQSKVMTHITVAQVPGRDKLLIFSDAAVIPQPNEAQFVAILGYVIDVCRNLRITCPSVALIHCTEKVSEKFPNTICYETMKEMATRGCFGDVVLGGPMDVKTACDAESGQLKGIDSPVVGNADALIFPDIQAGNVFYKTITLFAKAETAGMLCGTTAPIVVASRADTGESKFNSLVLACLTKKNNKSTTSE